MCQVARYTDEAEAAAARATLAPFAKNFLPVFFNLVEKLPAERRHVALGMCAAQVWRWDRHLIKSERCSQKKNTHSLFYAPADR